MMKSRPEASEELAHFSGMAPIFPLPNVVLFPHLPLPLHIFEERYRKMTADALHGDRLIAMALLQPGWEADYDGTPAIHEMVCLGKIVAEERLSSGRYNLILQGIQRAVVVEEPPTDLPYRVGRFELYRDFYPKNGRVNHEVRHKELLLSFRRLFPRHQTDALFTQVLDADIPLGVLCDILANALKIDPFAKQEILEELDVDLRSELVLTRIREALSAAGLETKGTKFPPEFSLN